jgi:hypothetical protein
MNKPQADKIQKRFERLLRQKYRVGLSAMISKKWYGDNDQRDFVVSLLGKVLRESPDVFVQVPVFGTKKLGKLKTVDSAYGYPQKLCMAVDCKNERTKSWWCGKHQPNGSR